jgi:hypothetical protein
MPSSAPGAVLIGIDLRAYIYHTLELDLGSA